ncbi:hypothetical protein EKN06_11885 [Croceicoccus ponticola]|uniref:DUF481 domain-containing protein n=1 Tax=Croceicoccus ponticola TaxID=2217664 RepID=A0A437GVX8_9SPHN|nr:hypothetical protein [Croceicoccus ponticola]RVQ66035.1 hypothetical protein EKN06_11885 [Croceicoccus ponticola]
MRKQNLGTVKFSTVVYAGLLAWSAAASAQEPRSISGESVRPAAGSEIWASTDSDGTDVVKVLGKALLNFEGREKYAGIAIEHAKFNPATGENHEAERIYLDLADHLGADWRWKARIGTDGKTLLGNAEFRKADWSQSVFVEREIVETEQGLARRIFYTFAGISTDVLLNDANTIALTAGVQEFSGKNERLHLRGKYVHVVRTDIGLSAQLDARYYHSTEPGEFDYFSPKDFVRLLPLIQTRRFSNSGWMYLAGAGFGAQHSSGGGWQLAKFGQLRLESPRSASDLDVFAEAIYTNDSISGGTNYDYLMARAGATFRF